MKVLWSIRRKRGEDCDVWEQNLEELGSGSGEFDRREKVSK